MAELKRVTTPVANTMTVIDKGDEISRPCSTASISRKQLKKANSEGLIALSPEPPGQVQFEAPLRPSSGGSRSGSAGRIEKKLQVLKKKVEGQAELRNINSADGRISRSKQPTDKTAATVSATPTENNTTKPALEEKPVKKLELNQEESSEDSSDTDSDDSDSDNEGKPAAPIELKGEFIKYLMDEDYEKAKELCQKILLLEPDNSVCIEFHGVIVQKLEQEKEAENDSDDDDSDEEDSDDEDEEEDENDDDDDSDDSDEEESESDSDEDDYAAPPGLNLIMGGLPIKPQSK